MIKLICFDFDGVFTNGKIYYNKFGHAIKYYNVKDGAILSLLKNKNIKSGLITAFYNDKGILVSDEEEVNCNVINHLKFDFKSIGNKNKLKILEEWMKNMNINFSNVAYIGDDLSDISILKKVAISGCPNDAINECKEIVSYVCKNNGGNGAVREFVDYILKSPDKITKSIKAEAIYQLNNFPIDEIESLSNELKDKNIYFTGIGKSENIANHCCSLLKSIGIKAYFINCINSTHGDIGTVSKNDILIMFSKSGNTKDLLEIVPYFKQKEALVYGVCCHKNSKFKDVCDKTIVLPLNSEIKNNIDTIPTNSYMAQLFFCNILVSKMCKFTNIENYKFNHPAGNIGKSLKKIKDVLLTEFPKIYMNENISLKHILLEMTKYKIGCCFFVNKSDELIGILSDGDIRRIMIKDDNINEIKVNNINTKYHYETNLDKLLINIEKIKNMKYIPILKNNKIIGIIDFRELI